MKRDTAGNMRLPIVTDDPNSPGTIFWNYIMHKMSPGQLRIHCKPATFAQKMAFSHQGRESMYSLMPLGHNTINMYFREVGLLLGLSKELKGHSLRGLCISKMVNGGVSITEVMATARHNSVSASATYQKRNGVSNQIKMKALGVSIPPKL